MDKKDFRRLMINELKKLSMPEYEQFSYEISKNLFKDECWQKAKVIGVTISKSPEVDTFQIIRRAWEEGKKVVSPKCHPKNKQMTFHELTKFTQLESVYYGLWEPIDKLTVKVLPEAIDLLIVPGLLFNNQGYRIGFGGGYYDRFLANYRGNTASLAFPSQLKDEFPVEEHDIPVQQIFTIDKVIKCYY